MGLTPSSLANVNRKGLRPAMALNRRLDILAGTLQRMRALAALTAALLTPNIST